MLVEIALIALIVAALCFLVITRRKPRRWNPTAREPEEQWKVIEFRRYARGFVYLAQSENDGHWIVYTVPSDGLAVASEITRYATEKKARAAYISTAMR
jgi:hypothetical protein